MLGGTAIGATIFSGSQFVQGVAIGTVISGGTQQVTLGGNATGTVVRSGGTQVVLFGGIVQSTTLLSGGIEVVDSQGEDFSARISGGTQIVSGIANGTTVFAGGLEVVELGLQPATNTTVSSGGTLEVEAAAATPARICSAGPR